MAHVVTQRCFGCKYRECVDVCPTDAFYEGEEMLFIDPETCLDCAQCVDQCPVEAIYDETEVPIVWEGFIALNAEMARQSPRPSSQRRKLKKSH